MSKYPAFNITLPPDIYEALSSRVKGSRERSATIARDLGRLYDLYKLALREVPLTTGESCLICDVLNGTLIDASSASLLWAEVADGIRMDDLDKKWGVDGAALISRLKSLDRLSCLALVDAAERFWAGDLSEEPRAAVRRHFYIQEGDRGE